MKTKFSFESLKLDSESYDTLFPKSTRFNNLKPRNAALVMAGLLSLILYGIIFQQPLILEWQKKNLGADQKNYRAIIGRIHSGEGYYQAAGSELRKRGYPTRSVFNWRLPSLAWFMGHLPNVQIAHILAIILASATLVIWISVLQNGLPFWKLFMGSFLMMGPVILSLLPDPFLSHELWAGMLISLSLAAYGRGWRALAVFSGLTALFLRELTLPFAVLMLVFSYMEGHRRESFVWLGGVLVFFVILGVHSAIVKGLLITSDYAQTNSWIALGGWSFVVNTAQLHPYLLLTPPWVAAIILPFSLIGFMGWPGSFGLRVSATMAIYILAFLFVGLDYNKYWGSMYANIMPLGFLYTFDSLKDLWKSVQRFKYY